MSDTSPLPGEFTEVAPKAQEEAYPICTRCGAEVEHIKYLDYETIRVVYHDPVGCVLGVLTIN